MVKKPFAVLVDHFFVMRFGTDNFFTVWFNRLGHRYSRVYRGHTYSLSTILRFMEEYPQFIHSKSTLNKFMLTDQQGDADMFNVMCVRSTAY